LTFLFKHSSVSHEAQTMFVPGDKLDAAFSLLKRDALRPGTRVLILVATDCDSLCAAKILVGLLKLCYISYSLRPVTCNESLFAALQEELDSSQSMDGDISISSCFLINCGNTVDLAGFLRQDHMQQYQPPITVYVCDSHLPAHTNNIQDQEQVCVFGHPSLCPYLSRVMFCIHFFCNCPMNDWLLTGPFV
jgi:hypothetical protein